MFWIELTLSILVAFISLAPTLVTLIIAGPCLICCKFFWSDLSIPSTLASISSFFTCPVLHIFTSLWTRLGRIDVVWVVYAGSSKHTKIFDPAVRIYRRLWMKYTYGIISRITRVPEGTAAGDALVGVVIALAVPLAELESDPITLQSTISRITRDFKRARAVALAGRLPSVCKKANVALKYPVIDGKLGIVCMAVDGVRRLERDMNQTQKEGKALVHDRDLHQPVVGVIGGGGHVGSMIVSRLMLTREVVVIDKSFEDTPAVTNAVEAGPDVLKHYRITRSSDPALLQQADIVLVFTPCGDDIREYIQSAAQNGQAWLDDTYPQMGTQTIAELTSRGAYVTKLTCTDRWIEMWPPVPGFRRGWLPGCLVSALIVALESEARQGLESDLERCEAAFQEIGFQTRCKLHADDAFSLRRRRR